MMQLRGIIAAGMCCFLVSCSLAAVTLPLHPIRLQGPQGQEVALDVEVARTPEARERGLMFRKTLQHGMLFTFDDAQPLTFWMKNTFVPLDVLFFDAAGSFISFQTMQPCTADPCPVYSSSGAALYALEMPEGFVRDAHIGAGWKLVR